MKKSRYTDSQIIAILKQAEGVKSPAGVTLTTSGIIGIR